MREKASTPNPTRVASGKRTEQRAKVWFDRKALPSMHGVAIGERCCSFLGSHSRACLEQLRWCPSECDISFFYFVCLSVAFRFRARSAFALTQLSPFLLAVVRPLRAFPLLLRRRAWSSFSQFATSVTGELVDINEFVAPLPDEPVVFMVGSHAHGPAEVRRVASRRVRGGARVR